MKKVFVVLMALLVLTSAAFANGAAEAPAAASKGLSGTITFVAPDVQSAGIEAAFEKYQETHPDVELDLVTYSTVTDFETMMTGYIAANTLPDMYVAQVGAAQQQYYENGYVMPLTDAGVLDNLVAGDRELISYNGEVYAFPMISEISAIICNNEVFKKAGIVIDETNFPKCWSDFLALCQKLRDAGVQYPVGIAGKDASSVTAWTFQYIYQAIYGADPNWYANILRGNRTWNDELYLEMFNKYGQMKEYISPAALGNDTNALYRDFIAGDCAIMFQVMQNVKNVRKVNPDMDVLCLPSCFNDDPAKQTVISGFGDGVSICSTTKVKDVCIDFLQYLTSDEGSTLYIDNASGVPSTRANHAKVDPSFQLVLTVQQKGLAGASPILSRQWIPGIKEVMKSAQQNWLSGTDAMVAATEIQNQHERLMNASPEWVKNFLDSYQDK